MRRLWRRVPSEGVHIAVESTRWGSDPAAPVLAVHGTSLCKEVFRPLIEELMAIDGSGDVTAIDQRCHGDSDVPTPPYSWWDLGADVLAVLDERPAVGFGHSSGAAALILAELLAPGTFAALVLVEPMVVPGPADQFDDHPLARGALKRKDQFADVESARDNFTDKPMFTRWDPRAFEAYLHHALVAGPDGVRLKCPPRAEAELYRVGSRIQAWNRLGEVSCPVTLVAGEHSDTHDRAFLELQAERFPSVETIEVVPGTSHFVAMEAPAAVAKHLASALDRHGRP